jgi:chaperonin GroES
MNIKPLADRVLLKAIEKDSITESWIYLPESANKEKPYIYEVIAVWEWTSDKKINVQVWEKVLCGQYAWDEIKLDGEEFKIVANEYILATVK